MTSVNAAVRKADLPAVIATRLDNVHRRKASLRLTAGLLDALGLFLAVLFAALVADWAFTLFSTAMRAALTYVVLGTGGVALLLLAVLPQLKRRSLTELAIEVDRSVPQLEERWQTVTRLAASSDVETVTGSPALINKVVAESIERERLVDPQSVVPGSRLRKHQWLLAAAIGANLALFVIDPAQAWILVRRFCSPTAPISLTQVTATTGDLAVARGEPIHLEATLARRPRDTAELFLRDSTGQITSVSLVAADADGTRFSYEIDAANEPLSYRFRAGDGQTGWHNVSVYDRPRLTSVALKLSPPVYTRLPVVTMSELPTSLRAVEGSQLEIAFFVDQPLDRFDLQLGGDSTVRLAPQGSDAARYVFQTKLEKTLHLTPVFVSRHGLSNVRLPSCQVIVYPDRPPEVTILSPEREISLRPTDEVVVELNARDDFGVVRAELVAFVGEQPDLQNALVLPPQSENATKTPDGAAAKDAAGANRPQAGTADGKTPGATRETDQSAPPVKKQSLSADGKTEASNSQTVAPKTMIVPIPLGAQAGEKNVRAKVKLDVRRFQLKHGQQLQYLVRVYDSHSTRSNAQSYADASKSQESKSPDSTADAAVTNVKKPSSAQSSSAQSSSAQSSGKGKTSAEGAQVSKSRMAKSTAPPATPALPAGTPKEPRSDRFAAAAKIDMSSPNQARQTAAGDRKGTPGSKPRPASDGQAAAGSSPRPPEPAAAQKNAAAANEPREQMTGAPRPPDAMSRRLLDVESQSAASSTMKIHIDQFAGSFEGQQRRKLELSIDPVLKELDAVLAKAIEELRPVSDALDQGKKPGDVVKKSLRAADTQIARGQSLVVELVQKSDGTPYAFIGLQLVDITELHISPARLDVKAAKAETPDRKQHVQQAEFHLSRAREMLADLTRKYETVKRDLKLAEDMQRIKMMYQFFVEDAMMFLATNRPTLNPKDRKMAELELDEDFLKQYRELQKEWEKTLAELAKALSKDPRLLARYMSLSRRRVDSLRDQLTLLNLRQQELLVPVEQLIGNVKAAAPSSGRSPLNAAGSGDQDPVKPRPLVRGTAAAGSETVRATLSRDLVEIATGTVGVQEDLGTWLPLQSKPDGSQLASLREQAARLSTTAVLAATASRSPKAEEAATTAKKVDALAAQLKTLEAALAGLAKGDDSQLVVPVNRRLARVRKLQQLTAAWTEKNAHVAGQRFHRAIEIDQHRLSEETLEFTGKLENAGAQLAGLPDEVLALADEVKEALRYDVLVDQMSAELRLRDGDLAAAKTHQKKAIEGFARAEEKFNKLIDRVIAEQDKVPPQVPDLDNMQLPTLEELLARLESETDLAELLGIPGRPTNLQGLRDWLLRNGDGSGAGNGMAASGRMQARLVDRARLDALRAARKAEQRDANARPVATAPHWNTLGSRLEDAVRQGRGNTPPRQYRRAIERYFELISGAKNASESVVPGVPKKENAAAPGGSTNNSP
jgi:hypothetical protein